MKTFIEAAQLGIACGLNSPVEWYVNASRALSYVDYKEISRKADELIDTFIEFYKGTAGCQEEEEWLFQLTRENFNERIVDPYYEECRRLGNNGVSY